MEREAIPINILLAEDDQDDRSLFTKALEQLPIKTKLTIVHDGEQLMSYLLTNSVCPADVLFLDLSMPRKTGFECLLEIKDHEEIKDLPVIVFSTSFRHDTVYEQSLIDQLSGFGAYHYIRKTKDFGDFKKNISDAILMVIKEKKY